MSHTQIPPSSHYNVHRHIPKLLLCPPSTDYESKELKTGEEYEGQAGSYSVKLNDLEIFSINYGGVSALTIQLFKGRPRPPLLEVRNKTASQLHLMFPGEEESVVVEANGASASQPRIAGKFSINHGSSEGLFFARENVNILAI